MADHENPLIILVEDNEGIARLIEFKLKKLNYRFIHYSNGVDGLEGIKEHRPDLAILDVMLPGMIGFEILRRIREDEDEEIKNTKVLMLTSKNREEDLERGFKLKVADYLSKPFKATELTLRIERILNDNQ